MIARWESGRTDVVLGTAFRLAKVLKVPPETLIF